MNEEKLHDLEIDLLLEGVSRKYGYDFRNYARENLGKQYPSVLDYILLHASPELKHYIESSKPKIRYVPYDWSLNDAGK